MIKIIVQVDGKLRGVIAVDIDLSENEVEEIVLKDLNISRFILGKYKIIYVKNKVVNFVNV
jgi:leucyl-tRNA synthetase